MIKLALVGCHISHSRSQEVYESLLDKKISYDLLDYPKEETIPSAKELLSKYLGVSITSPYKKHFFGQVEVTPEIENLGAINCLYQKNQILFGTNTDYLALKKLFPSSPSQRVALLGDGSMSQLCQKFLKERNDSFQVFSRKTHGDLALIDYNGFDLVINCCARSFLFSGTLKSQTLFWDLNYNLTHTGLIENYRDGLEFLRVQAEESLRCWDLTSKNL